MPSLHRLTLEDMDAAALVHRASFDSALPRLTGLQHAILRLDRFQPHLGRKQGTRDVAHELCVDAHLLQ